MALDNACSLLQEKAGELLERSSIYETDAWGDMDQPRYLNQVVKIDTDLDVRQLLRKVLEIEKDMGRVRTVKNASRIIDIDILFFANLVIKETGLTIPHPFLQDRLFVLIPLNEIGSDVMHPKFKKTVGELLLSCRDKLAVRKI